jgi:ATP-binding cassette subfamily F protein 3
VKRFGAKASKATQAESRKKMIAKMPVLEKLAHLYQLDFQFNFKAFPGQKMAQMDHLDFSYTLEPFIQDFSLSIEREERIAIIGKNGEGKSTLLRLLYGDLKPSAGMIKRSENAVIGYFGQSNIDRLDPTLSVEEEISQANPILNLTQVRAICGQMCFSGDAALKKISQLSGGERSRVLLGKILAIPCNLILLDEPTNHLDIESVEALLEAIENFPGTVVMITHSELILERIPFTKLIVCRPGKQELFLGSYEEFLSKNGWGEEEKKEGSSKNASAYHVDKKQKSERNLQTGKIKRDIEQLEARLAELEQAMDSQDYTTLMATTHEIERIYSQLDILYKQL